MHGSKFGDPFSVYSGRTVPEENSLEIDIAISIDTMRFSRHWSQKELARKLGTSQSAIARLESGWLYRP